MVEFQSFWQDTESFFFFFFKAQPEFLVNLQVRQEKRLPPVSIAEAVPQRAGGHSGGLVWNSQENSPTRFSAQDFIEQGSSCCALESITAFALKSCHPRFSLLQTEGGRDHRAIPFLEDTGLLWQAMWARGLTSYLADPPSDCMAVWVALSPLIFHWGIRVAWRSDSSFRSPSLPRLHSQALPLIKSLHI